MKELLRNACVHHIESTKVNNLHLNLLSSPLALHKRALPAKYPQELENIRPSFIGADLNGDFLFFNLKLWTNKQDEFFWFWKLFELTVIWNLQLFFISIFFSTHFLSVYLSVCLSVCLFGLYLATKNSPNSRPASELKLSEQLRSFFSSWKTWFWHF